MNGEGGSVEWTPQQRERNLRVPPGYPRDVLVNQVEPERELPQALKRLGATTTTLHEAVDILASRLNPMLRIVPEKPSPEKCPKCHSSTIAGRIENECGSLLDLRVQLEELISRLEL